MSRASLFSQIGALVLCISACSNTRRSAPAPVESVTEAQEVPPKLLSGRFVAVAKRASGTARYAVENGTYYLVLNQVEVDTTDPVHVYLVSRDEAPTTSSVEAVEDKYDIGELTPGQAEQRFELPSAPAPELRVAVLWNPKYGVNLAQAPLR